jgi:hypothetical protein
MNKFQFIKEGIIILINHLYRCCLPYWFVIIL